MQVIKTKGVLCMDKNMQITMEIFKESLSRLDAAVGEEKDLVRSEIVYDYEREQFFNLLTLQGLRKIMQLCDEKKDFEEIKKIAHNLLTLDGV
jgi:hypothetical protein